MILQHLLRPATASQQKIVFIVVLVGLATSLLLYLVYLTPPVFTLDDSYIVLHNAQVLHKGFDANYLHSPALSGATSLIHLALITLCMFWLPAIWSSAVVIWLAILLYALGLLRLAFVCSASCLQACAFLLTGLLVANTPLQLLSGLETGLAMALLTWLLVLLVIPVTRTTRILRNLLCGLLPFCRPELALFSVLVFSWEVYRYWQQSVHFWRDCFFDGVLICLAAAPWLLWYWVDLGSIFPNTLTAKLAFFAEQNVPFHLKLSMAYFNLWQFSQQFCWPGLVGMIFLLLLTPTGRLGIIFLAGVFLFYLMYFPTALGFNQHRYLFIWIPMVLFGAASTLQHQRLLIRYTANFLLAITFLQAVLFFPVRWHNYLLLRQYYAVELPAVKQWCEQHIPAHAILLVHDAGYLAYATNFQLLDMVGLKSPELVQYHQKITLLSIGKQRIKALSAIVANRHPDYLIVTQEWNKVFGITSGLMALGWHLQLLRTSQAGYLVYKIIYP